MIESKTSLIIRKRKKTSFPYLNIYLLKFAGGPTVDGASKHLQDAGLAGAEVILRFLSYLNFFEKLACSSSTAFSYQYQFFNVNCEKIQLNEFYLKPYNF